MHDVGCGKMLQLNSSIYGLVEAAYLWLMDLSAILVELGWLQGVYGKCVFLRASPKGLTDLVLYVDDGLMGHRTPNATMMNGQLSMKLKSKLP